MFVLQIVCWPFLQRFVCSGADKLSETATSGGNCRRGAHSAMLWNTVQSVEIQCKALKYSTKLWNTTQCVVVSNFQWHTIDSVQRLKIWSSMLQSKCYRLPWNATALQCKCPFVRANYPTIQSYRDKYLELQYKCGVNCKNWEWTRCKVHVFVSVSLFVFATVLSFLFAFATVFVLLSQKKSERGVGGCEPHR